MSALKRILIGTAGNSVGIGLIFAQRILITPLVLSAWNTEQYGFYLALAAAINLFAIPGRSFEYVINRELLRIGGDVPARLRALHGGAVLVSLALEAVLAVIAYFFLRVGVMLGPEATHLLTGREWVVAVAMFVSRAFNAFPGSTYAQVLSCYGYFPKLVWLGLVGRLLSVVVPGAGAYTGFGPVAVTMLDLLAPCLFLLPAWGFLRRWARRVGVWGWAPEVRQAFHILLLSTQNLLAEIVIMIRGEGLRVILSSLSGSVALAAFATMRTGANLALQGLSTVSSPLMPELMRYLRARDQERMESAFCVMWLPIIALMCPLVILLQLFIAPLFSVWTRGKVEFDPMLFAILSASVLFNATAQPAASIVSGNNLLRAQLVISIIISAMVVAGVFLATPLVGIVGAAAALLVGECGLVTCYVWRASRWLRQNELGWPMDMFFNLLFAITLTSVALLTIAWVEMHGSSWSMGINATVSLLVCLGLGFSGRRFWGHLPPLARARLQYFLKRKIICTTS